MRVMISMILAMGLAGCMENPPSAPYALAPTVAYPNCGRMAALRNNLTGAPYPSSESDARLRALGVRCIGDNFSTVRARY